MDKSIVSIVKNSTYPDAKRIEEMTAEAVELLGGYEKIIKKGDFVVIKGNFFAPYPPPVTVDRRIVSALIKQVFKAGASRVVLCEAVSVGTKLGRKSSTRSIMDELGITEVAISEGAEVLCLEDDTRIKVTVPDAKSISEIDYPETLYKCDVLIDLPCMKTHGLTLVTLGIKNFQGLLTDVQKYYAHRDDLEQKLVDIFKIRKPDLTLIDCLIAMEGNGSGEHGIPHPMNMLIASTDVVAADSVATACMGIEDVLDVISTRLAQFDGIGNADLDKIEVVGAQINDVKEHFLLPAKYLKPVDRALLGVHKNVDVRVGGACRLCWIMGGNMAKMLTKYPDHNFTLIIGIDPKVANPEKVNIENLIFLGDCACSATGPLKDLRTKMLLEKKGVLAYGCPPYRPASAMVEEYLIKRGLLTSDQILASNEASLKRTYDYYKSVDPTWIPLSQRTT